MGGLKGCFRLDITFSGYVFVCKAFLPSKKKKEVYVYRLLTLLPLKT